MAPSILPLVPSEPSFGKPTTPPCGNGWSGPGCKTLQRYGHLYPGAAAQAAMALDLYLKAAAVGQMSAGDGSRDDEEPETPMIADGACRARTGDPQLAKLVLSQLS